MDEPDTPEEVTPVPNRLLLQAFLVLIQMPKVFEQAMDTIFGWVPSEELTIHSVGREGLEMMVEFAAVMDLVHRTASEVYDLLGEEQDAYEAGPDLIGEATRRGWLTLKKSLIELAEKPGGPDLDLSFLDGTDDFFNLFPEGGEEPSPPAE